MKMTSLGLLLIFITIKILANENWIKIEPTNKTKTPKSNTKIDVDLSQIEPINKMIKKVAVVKQLIDATSKKDEPSCDDKNWFVLNTTDSQ